MIDDRSSIKAILDKALEELVFGVEVRPIAARVMVKLKKYGYFSQRNHDKDLLREFYALVDKLSGGLFIACNKTGSYSFTPDDLIDQFLKERQNE